MVTLVVGGAKSGKSMFSQNLAKALENKNGKLYYVATMNPYDLEDLKRIENHLNEREGYGFNTIEETLDMKRIAKILSKEDTVLIDSITSLVTNSMFKGKDFIKEVNNEIINGILEIINLVNNVVIVSDYLFSDSIQYDGYTESFRKEIGIINRKLAELADNIVECSYGNIIYHKNLSNVKLENILFK